MRFLQPASAVAVGDRAIYPAICDGNVLTLPLENLNTFMPSLEPVLGECRSA